MNNKTMVEHQARPEGHKSTALPAGAAAPDFTLKSTSDLAGKHTARVREDFRGGARDGVNGTPTFFVNGVRYDGEPDVEALLAALTKTPLR